MTTNLPFTDCHAITKAGGKCQSPTDVYATKCLVKQGEAVPADLVSPNNFGGWILYTVPLCSIHAAYYTKTGNAVKIQSTKNLKEEAMTMSEAQHERAVTDSLPDDQDNTVTADLAEKLRKMNTNELETHFEELAEDGHETYREKMSYETEAEWKAALDCISDEMDLITKILNDRKGVLCGACGEHHPTTNDVRLCYRKVVKLPMHQNKGVLCGNCRKQTGQDTYHPTVVEVKACYAKANNS